MNLPAAGSLVAAAVAMAFAVLSLGLATAPGWKELRWFALIAATASGYALCDIVPAIDASDAAVIWGAQLSIVLASAHIASWIGYVAALGRRPSTRLECGLAMMLCAVGVIAFIPGVFISSVVIHRTIGSGVAYADAIPTPLGGVSYALMIGSFGLPLSHYIRQWRGGVAGARSHAIGLMMLSATGVNDALAATGVLGTPYLIDLGFLTVVVAVGGATVRRFVESARAHEQLSNRLERDVVDRTRDLVRTQEELMRAEKLAALGRLSAGVAHEINNPTAAIVANLGYLSEEIEARGTLPHDGLACIRESLACTDRIAGIVRQLLSAGRMAGQIKSAESFHLVEALASARVASRAALGDRVTLETEIPTDVCVLGEKGLLEQALVNVIVNAAQAIEAGKGSGCVRLTTELRGARVLLRISDNGPGMPEGSVARLFEPFFTTKGLGKGTGLGLAVSRGLVRTFGGELAMESTSARGTTMLLDLPIGKAPAQSDSQARISLVSPRYRLLVVDDDQSVRSALGRALSGKYAIELAEGVTAALECAARGAVDLILCDVMMPDGGGPRLLSELEKINPALAAATIFLTGGATTPASQAFVELHGPRVLHKPLDHAALGGIVRKLLGGSPIL